MGGEEGYPGKQVVWNVEGDEVYSCEQSCLFGWTSRLTLDGEGLWRCLSSVDTDLKERLGQPTGVDEGAPVAVILSLADQSGQVIVLDDLADVSSKSVLKDLLVISQNDLLIGLSNQDRVVRVKSHRIAWESNQLEGGLRMFLDADHSRNSVIVQTKYHGVALIDLVSGQAKGLWRFTKNPQQLDKLLSQTRSRECLDSAHRALRELVEYQRQRGRRNRAWADKLCRDQTHGIWDARFLGDGTLLLGGYTGSWEARFDPVAKGPTLHVFTARYQHLCNQIKRIVP